jgi:hypothetical protein
MSEIRNAAPEARGEEPELSDETLEEVAGGTYINEPVIQIGPPPFVTPEPGSY